MILLPVVLGQSAPSHHLAMLSVAVKLVSSPTLIPSLAANRNVSLTPIVKEDSFAKVRSVLKNQTLATHHLVDQEPFVQLTLPATPFVGASLG